MRRGTHAILALTDTSPLLLFPLPLIGPLALATANLPGSGQRSVADERTARTLETAALQRSLEEATRTATLRADEAAAAHHAELQAAEDMLAAVRAGAAEARAQLQAATNNLTVRPIAPFC